MDSNASDAVQTPATVLMVSGIVLILFYLFYAIWTGVGLAFGCMNVGIQGLAMTGESGSALGLGVGVWGLLLSTISVVFYLALAAGGAFVLKSALGMKNLENIGGARKGAILAAVVPVLGLVMGALLSIASFSCCGLVTGSIPQIVVLVIGGVGAGLAWTTLSDDAVSSGFES